MRDVHPRAQRATTITADSIYPSVSVIIPVWNDEQRLRRCLQALEAQTYPVFEVIVVDNGSERPPDVADFPAARLLYEPRPGSYAARNRGIEDAAGSILAFTDSDCVPPPEWLERGVELLVDRPDVGMVGGPVELFADGPGAGSAGELFDMQFGFPQDYYATVGFTVTANLITRREVIDAVGPFNARLKSHGDREWGLRANRAGFVLEFSEAVSVRHPARTLRELVRKELRKTGGSHLTWKAGDPSQRLSLQKVFRPPLRSRWRATAALPTDARLRVLGVDVLLHGIFLAERVRLLLGGRPRR